MVRPEDPRVGSCCSELTGESPVRVGVGAPGSRPQPIAERRQATAGRRKPHRREQERGPQHQVNPAASSDKQCGSRAGHVTAKATSSAEITDGALGPAGVWGVARADSSLGNRRDPSARPTSGRDRSYKPKVKSTGAQRESEGVVVPWRAVQENAAGGKGPCFGDASTGGKSEGMVRTAGPKDPGGLQPIDRVRRLQRKLYVAAERDRGRRFRALYHTHRSDVLWVAWERDTVSDTVHAALVNTIGKPCAGKPHARFERGWVETGP
jgi:hypothetical protein